VPRLCSAAWLRLLLHPQPFADLFDEAGHRASLRSFQRFANRNATPLLAGLTILAVEALLLFEGALCSGDRLEPFIGNRLTALDREAERASGEPLLSMLDSRKLAERAWLTVVRGTAQVEAGGSVVDADPGTLLTFEPGERHSVASERGAQILLILAPWPGEGHYPADDPANAPLSSS
jgi:AraC-like ligand binding domain